MSNRTLIIGNKNYSTWSLRPWLFLRKNNIDFEERLLWLDEPEFKSAIDPVGSGGKVPVLLDGDEVIWDSLAIIESVIDRYPCALGWPEDSALRAHARSIVCEMHSSYPALRNQCSMDIRQQHTITLSDDTQLEVQRICDILTQALTRSGNPGQWLYGDFSVADAMFAPVVFRFKGYGIEVPEIIQAYMEFVLADETLAEWIEAAKKESHALYE